MPSTSSGYEFGSIGQGIEDDLELTVDLDEILSFKPRTTKLQKKQIHNDDNEDFFDDFINGLPKKQSTADRKGQKDVEEYSLLEKTANSTFLQQSKHNNIDADDDEELYENIINNLEEAIRRERQMQKALKRILGK